MKQTNKNAFGAKAKTYLKLFILLLTIGYIIMPEQSSAADIVVRAVKIKKKNPKSYDCHCDLPNSAYKNFDIDSMTITSTTSTTYIKGGGTETKTELSFAFTVEIKKRVKDWNDEDVVTIKRAILDFNLIDAKGTTEAVSLKPTYNEKTGQYEAFLGTTKYPQEDSYLITLTNTKGDSVFFEKKKEDDKIKNEGDRQKGSEDEGDERRGNTDSCKTNFKLKEISSTATTQSGIYAVGFTFSFQANSDAPTTVDMIVQLTNCKGETKNIRVKLSGSNGSYAGGIAMAQDKECSWKLTYGEVYAYNPCGDETDWTIDFGQTKTNGTGTRSGAASNKGAKPTLK